MKKILAALLASAIALSLVGCSMAPTNSTSKSEQTTSAENTASTSSAAPARTATMKIGILVPTLQGEFFISLVEGVKEVVAAKGYTLIPASFDSDSSKAIAAVENFIVADVDAIIAMVWDSSCDATLKQAMDKGIKVLVSGVETEFYDVCMVADNGDVGTKIAEMAADFVKEKHGGKAEIAIVTSASNVDMIKRSDGIVAGIAALLPESKIVMRADTSKVGESGAFTENVLQQYPNTKVFLAISDQQALEMVEVVKAAGKAGDDVAAFACDCTTEGLKKIEDNDIFRGTVSLGDLVEQTTEYTLRMLENDPTLEKKIIGENIKVTSANVKDYLK